MKAEDYLELPDCTTVTVDVSLDKKEKAAYEKLETFMELVERLNGLKDKDDWNERKIDILLAYPASAAYGLNLQKGRNHAIWFGPNWSLELYQQANKRLHRQGQTEKVIVHHLVVEGGVDEDVMAALEYKGATQERLMNALKARIEKYKILK